MNVPICSADVGFALKFLVNDGSHDGEMAPISSWKGDFVTSLSPGRSL